MEASAAIVERLAASPDPVYGVSTGFGSLANTVIPAERREELQRALIRSHAAGMGPPVEREVVRAMMLLRARTLAMAVSGVRPVLVETILELLNRGLTPVVREHGSLGASGDLAPLAHAALALIGEGEVCVRDGAPIPAAQALADAGLAPVTLRAKEGLALVNGTDGILGMLLLALHDLENLFRVADVACAMTVEALLGTDRAFADDLQQLRPHPGQRVSATNLRTLLAGSAIVASHLVGDLRVQDAYSLRCAPQVHGAARDTATYASDVAAAELVSAIDNPMVLSDGRVESCGNFHGAPLGFACDFLAIAAAEVGSIAERRTDRLLDANRSYGLPPFLAPDPGVNSGMMIAQYTQAAMVAENRRLAAPASVDSLPDERDAGGPRVDGVGRGAQAADGRGQPRSHPRGRGRLRRPGPRSAGTVDARGRYRCRARRGASPNRRTRSRSLVGARARGRRAARRRGRAGRGRQRRGGRSAVSGERSERATKITPIPRPERRAQRVRP